MTDVNSGPSSRQAIEHRGPLDGVTVLDLWLLANFDDRMWACQPTTIRGEQR